MTFPQPDHVLTFLLPYCSFFSHYITVMQESPRVGSRWSIISLNGISYKDAGEYRCQAQNMAGKAEAYIRLKVVGFFAAPQTIKNPFAQNTKQTPAIISISNPPKKTEKTEKANSVTFKKRLLLKKSVKKKKSYNTSIKSKGKYQDEIITRKTFVRRKKKTS